MHTHACTCQLAECRPWRLSCSMTCISAEMTKIPFITILLCVSPSYFSLSTPPPPFFIVYLFFSIARVFWKPVSRYPCLFHFTPTRSHLSLFSSFFSDVTALYFLFHSCTVPICPQTVSYITLEHNSKNKK